MPLWIECVQGGKHFDTEYRLRNSRGEYRWHLSRAVPVRVDHVITQWVGTLTDIHELKNAEEALRNSEQRLNGKAVELAQANEELLHFAYAVSHDLRAPLRTVIAFAQLLSVNYDARLDDDGKELVLRIVNAGSRMTALLRDLLVFAEVGGMEARASETIPLAEPLATAQQNLSSEMRETGAKITWDPLPAVAGQAVRMTQLFQNLLGNSLKYRKPGTPPQIHVSAEPSGAEWVITVRDNGVGFEPRYAGTIFGVFRRLHGNEVAGTGLGLAICKRIVERMGGRIWATGEPGVGAAFSFALPVADAATESARRQ
jgi:light-regulated signal transduction histidine kinase (bacteriophytochrome)